MQSKDLLRVTIKTVGALTMVWAVPQFIQFVHALLSIMNQPGVVPEDVVTGYRFSLLFQALIPILLFTLGLSMLRSGEFIIRFAFNNDRDEMGEQVSYPSLFFLFIKITGLVMVIYAVPDLIQIISDVIFNASVKSSVEFDQASPLWSQAPSDLFYLLIGLYLLRSGKFIYNLAYRNKG